MGNTHGVVCGGDWLVRAVQSHLLRYGGIAHAVEAPEVVRAVENHGLEDRDGSE